MPDINPKDILNLDNIESIVRSVMSEKETISLADFKLEPYQISKDYQKAELSFKEGTHKEVREHLLYTIKPTPHM